MVRNAIFLVIVTLSLVGCAQAQIPPNGSATPRAIFTSTVLSVATATKTLDVSVNEPPAASATVSATVTKTLVSLTTSPTNLTISTRTPTRTPTRTLTRTPTRTPTQTSTPPTDSDLYLLRIVAPGPMSKVVSPVDFIVHIAPGYTGTTRIELFGEDGSVLFRKIFKTYSNVGYYTRIAEKIDFEIRGAAEVARLQISTLDNYGRLQALNSVRLLLQAIGDNQITAGSGLQDRLLLRSPTLGAEITGGSLVVSGECLPVNNLPIVLELIDIDGTVLGSRLLQLDQPVENLQKFTTTIPYQITKKTSVRLVIRQADERIDGLAYLFSLPVILIP